MRPHLFALALGCLALSPHLASAQTPTAPVRELHVVSPVPGQELFFRVEMDASTTRGHSALQLLSSSTVMRTPGGIHIQTPAVLAITTESPFAVTLAPVTPNQQLQVVVRREDHDLLLSGDHLRFARQEPGGKIELRAAQAVYVRPPR